MKIAIVGAGIFGVTTAIKLAKNHSVDLFEKNSDILMAASGINQYRLHRGYHYPRSSETARSSMEAEPKFKQEYSEAVLDDAEHYYCIAKEDSFVDAKKFIDFCNKCDLEIEVSSLDIVNSDRIDKCFKVKETRMDPVKLRKMCWERLKKNNVNVLLNTEIDEGKLSEYDYVVNCTYAWLNSVLKNIPEAQKDYQFELCEKIVLSLPENFKGKSVVIMDGPFMCLDPYSDTDFFVMGNVVHAIHQTNVGKHPIIDERFLPLLDKGIIKNPPITNFDKFIESASEFIPDITKAVHVGSMFTIRTVLPHLEDTDARPTIVEKINNRIINVFSGKIGNCVEAAEDVVKMIDG